MANKPGMKPRSGISGVRYQKKDCMDRPWQVVYKEHYYGYFPTVEEAAEFLEKVKESVDAGKPAPENPYKGQRHIKTGDAAKTTTGVSGIQKLTCINSPAYKVVYKQKGYGQYRTMAEAKTRLDEVLYCINNGLEIPPSPAQKKHQEHIERVQRLEEEREKARKYKEDQKRLREQKKKEEAARAKMEREANRSRPCRQARNSVLAVQTQAMIRDDELAKQNGFVRQRNANNPEPVPIDQRPKFKGRTQKQRDHDACSKCYWSNVYMGGKDTTPGKIYCGYGIHDGNRPRLVLHYERTGTQNPHTLTHGENCTEWTPKKGKQRENPFTIKNDPY